MNKLTKRILSVFLAVAMIVTFLPPVTAQAATKSITMYKGEELSYTDYGKVSKCSSSNKKVLKVSKNSKQDYYTDMTAKKVGKANVTIKSKYGTTTLKVNVKEAKFNVTPFKINSSYVTLKIENKTAQTFDKLLVKYTFKDAEGEVVTQNEEIVYNVIAKKSVFVNIFVGSSQAELIDLSTSSAKVTAVAHDPRYVYKDVSSKVKVTADDEDGKNINIKIKNTVNQSINGRYYIYVYDEAGKVLGVESSSLYQDKKSTKTTTAYISSYTYPDYSTYEVKVQAFTQTKAKGW